MTPKQGDRIKFKGKKGYVLAFYKKADYYFLNIALKDHTESWTYLSEKDIKTIEKV